MSNTTATSPRKNFAIMRLGKISSMTVLRHVSNHNTRTVTSENVEQDGPAPIELLANGSDDFVASAKARMAELGIDPATTAGKIIAVEVVVSASRDWFKTATDADKVAWQTSSVAWATQLFGRGLLTAKLHQDEEVDHIHFVAIPAVEKKRLRRGRKPKSEDARRQREEDDAAAPMIWTLAYHDLLGGKSDRLSQEQDTYHGFVRHLGLERGEKQPEVTEIEIGDELTIAVDAYARGTDAQGKPRPRRNITPREGRAIVKRLRSEAEADRSAASLDRAAAAAERYATTRNHEAIELEMAALKSARASLDVDVRTLVEDRQGLDLERLEVEAERQAGVRRQRDRQAALDAAKLESDRRASEREDELAHRHRKLSAREQELAAMAVAAADRMAAISRIEAETIASASLADAARAAAETARVSMEAALAGVTRLGEETVADRAAATKAVDDVAIDRRTLAAERETFNVERSRFDAERRLHERQFALLLRASDDDAGLDLRPTDKAFSMRVDAMLPDERATYEADWLTGLKRLGQHLARVLEKVRELAVQLVVRERKIELREAAISKREQDAERDRKEREAEHAADAAELQRQERDLGAREDAISSRTVEIETKAADTAKKEAETKAARIQYVRWAMVIGAVIESPDLIKIVDNRILLDPDASLGADAKVVQTLQDSPPIWAFDILCSQLEIVERDKRAAEHEKSAAQSVEELKALLASAGRELTPVQQTVASKVDQAVQAWQAAKSAER